MQTESEIVGVYIGARDEAAACKLWESLPPVYRQFLGSVWSRYTPVNDSKTSYRRAIQQYIEATGVSASPKNLVLFKILGESHWCHLVFHSSLQCIITCVALPILCGPKDLSIRTHQCHKCGLELDRDINAAVNILERALQAVGLIASACGGFDVSQPVKQEDPSVKRRSPRYTRKG